MRKIENCKAIKKARERWKIVKPIISQRNVFGNRVSDHYARNIYIKVSKNSCLVDLIDLKNTFPKH